MNPTLTTDPLTSYTSVTEMPGQGQTKEGMSMLVTRYVTAARMAKGKDVLDVSCGPGMGIGLLLQEAKSVTAGDFDTDMVAKVNETYSGRVTAQQLDATALPFADSSFDLVLIMESIYFMPEGQRAITEAARVLRPGGKLFIATANRDWTSFNPAPMTHHYFTAAELVGLFQKHGLQPEIKVGFRDEPAGIKGKIFSVVRKLAVTFRLIPDTMEGKEKLKRLVYGPLPTMPDVLKESDAEFHEFVDLGGNEVPKDYKVVYAIGTKG